MSLLRADYASLVRLYENKKVYPAPREVKNVWGDTFKQNKPVVFVSSNTPTLFTTDKGIQLRVKESRNGDSNFLILNCDIHIWISIWVSEKI